jgi:7-cyano-7-deazaguanine synthase in queuosine biosynthesis
MNFDELASGLPAQLTFSQLDWLEILGHLLALDISCDRGHGDVDWTRSIEAWLPVRDPDFWEAYKPAIEAIFGDLTDDQLVLHFEQDAESPTVPRMATTPFPEHAGVALVSGGQDSFAGALSLLNEGIRPLLLSHTASGATNTAQSAVEAALRATEPELRRIKLSARKAQNMALPGSESSQRSRTFLFVGAAALVAACSATNQVWLNENGVMALHLPLTPARIGSFSTHTASPPIVDRIRALAGEVLQAPIEVENRLIALTKPEVVREAIALGAGPAMADTVSCWQIGRTRTHCGMCAPCLLRRIACESHGLADVPYANDLFDDAAALDDEIARDNLVHMLVQLRDLKELDELVLEYEYPELLNCMPGLTLNEAIDLHRRWSQQALGILEAHPVPSGLL